MAAAGLPAALVIRLATAAATGRGVLRAAVGMRVLQAGSLHAYLAYVLVLGVLILIWLGGPM